MRNNRYISNIVIDDGKTFSGTPEQFRDCFFNNVSIEEIIDFAQTHFKNAKLVIEFDFSKCPTKETGFQIGDTVTITNERDFGSPPNAVINNLFFYFDEKTGEQYAVYEDKYGQMFDGRTGYAKTAPLSYFIKEIVDWNKEKE